MFYSVPVERLAPMFDPAAGDSEWSTDDLVAIYQHQVSTPLDVEFAAMEPAQRQVMNEFLGDERRASILSLLRHESPPVEALGLLKDYAKVARDHPTSPIPLEVATTLYWLAVAAALVRCGRRISSLPVDDLDAGFIWASTRPWIDLPEAALVVQAMQLVKPHPE